jgi:hypothetical protein
MIFRESAERETRIFPSEPSFQDIVRDSCKHIWARKVEYSLRRIEELDRILERLDQDLAEFITAGHAR